MNVRTIPAKVLLVDDWAANLLVLEAALSGFGYELVKAQSGEEALLRVQMDDFAVVLLDVRMPGMDGFETATQIRAVPRARALPIIFLTANYPSEDQVLQGYEAGAVDYLSKPFNTSVLRAKVAVFVELYRRNIENQRQAERIAMMERRERERAVEKLKRETEHRYQRLVESIRDGIVWAADVDMRKFTFVSKYATRITGCPPERWCSEVDFWGKHVHADDRERVMRAFAKIRVDGEPFVLEHRFTKPSGEVVWFHTGAYFDATDDVVAKRELRGLSFDITHLKETESALRASLAARDEFLSIASHELRTPITPLQLQMQGFIRFIEIGMIERITPQKLREMLEVSESQVARLARLVSQLLDVSRINAGRFALELEETSLSVLVRRVVQQMHHEISAAECTVTLDLDEGLLGLWDRSRLEQVVTNLLTNSLKYGPGKPIEIRTASDGDTVTLTVKDQGFGIAKEDQERIFLRFERAVSACHYGGLGLGLYISRQIVDLHQGFIRVDSDGARGAVFTVVLPVDANRSTRLDRRVHSHSPSL